MTALLGQQQMSRYFTSLQRRFGGARPGLQLIAIEDAAVPVTMIRADTLAQERTELPVTEAFALRFVNLGVDTPAEIADYLGLDKAHVLDAVAAQIAEGHLDRTRSGERLALSKAGSDAVSTLAATRPVLRQLPLAFDRLTWRLADYPERTLITKKDAQDLGMTLLPASRHARIGNEDVTPSEFNRLLQKSNNERVQVLRIHKVVTRKHLYLPVQLLIFGDEGRLELELAVLLDDELVGDHGVALERIGAVERLGLKIEPAEPRPMLDGELEDQRSFGDYPSADREIGTPPNLVDTSSDRQEPIGVSATIQVRSVSVFEHADLLAEALTTAKKRLLIISPWIRGAVVNTDFLSKLEQRLRAKVEVTIAHGIGDDDTGSDERALRKLKNLADRYDNLEFARLGNTHAKILIFDDIWVSTSFNWLSFRGDPDRTYRMEEGTLVAIPPKVQQQYEQYQAMIRDQKRPS
jgi:hypothetical protein